MRNFSAGNTVIEFFSTRNKISTGVLFEDDEIKIVADKEKTSVINSNDILL